MTITAEMIGKRLRLAREARQVTQDAAAKAIDLNRSAVSLIESGQRSVSTLELTRLAHLYGKPVAWFVELTDIEEVDDPIRAVLRADPSLDPEVIQKQVGRCVTLFREGIVLSRLLGREIPAMPPRYDWPPLRSTGQAIEQGQTVADQERRRLQLGTAPVRSIPELIGSQGLWVSATRLPKEFSGLFLRGSDFGMAVLVNLDHPPVRRRFSHAHEYGHALMDRDRQASVTSQTNAKDLIEQRANAFAAAFLMPADGVRDFLHGLGKGRSSRREEAVVDAFTQEGIRGELRVPPRSQDIAYTDVALLARHFGASYSAAVWRLRGLNIVNLEETNVLLQQIEMANRYLRAVKDSSEIDGAGGEAPADEHEDNELGLQILALALEAWRREEISQGRLLEIGRLLGIDDETILDLAEAVGIG